MAKQARLQGAMPLVALVCALAGGPAWAAVSGRLSGQVTAPDGRPVAGVTVAAGRASALTDAGGLYALEGVPTGSRVVVSFSKAGAATTFGTVELPPSRRRPGPHAPAPGATLHRTLLPTGVVRSIDPVPGGSVEVAGYRVTFPPGSIAACGPVDVALTPLDPAGPALGAFPGDFHARGRVGEDVRFETWGALDMALSQRGKPVRLAAPARIEILLPSSSPLAPGEHVPLFSFRGRSGSWRESLLRSVVGKSTVLADRLAAFGAVARTGWWSVGREVEAACLCGRVEDARGLPVAGALVAARGLDHHAVTTARSGADGSWCVAARRGSEVAVAGSVVAEGLRLDSAPVAVEAPRWTAGHCRREGCGEGPTLALPETSCVCGRTLDGLGQPRPGVTVATSAGSAQASDDEGRFCLGAPSGRQVRVYGDGYPPAAVETTPGPATCPDGCAVVDLVPESGPPAVACLTGRVLDWRGVATLAASVQAVEPSTGAPLGPFVYPDEASFLYTLAGLPSRTVVRVEVQGPDCAGSLLVTAGPGGPVCTPVPDIACAIPSP
jgi:hypothetical protein